MTEKTIIQPKTRQEMALEQGGIDPKTLTHWIKTAELDIPERQRLTAKHQKIFYEKYGYPKGVNNADYDDIEF